MLDSGDTGMGSGDTSPPCESVQGSGCRLVAGEPQQAPCETESFASDSGVDEARGEIVGGACQCHAAAQAPFLALVLLLWPLLRRVGPASVLMLMVGVAHGGTDAQLVQVLDGGAFPTLRDADLEEPWSLAGTISVNYARDPVVFVDEDGTQVLLRKVTTRELAASVNLFGYLRLGMAFPSHRRVVFEGVPYDKLPGDLTFWIALPLAQRDRWSLAWYTITELSTGSADQYLGDPSGILAGLLAAEVPAGPFRLVGNLGIRLQPAVALPGFVQQSRWCWGAGLRLEPAGSMFATAELQGGAPASVLGGAPGEYPVEVVGHLGYEMGGIAAASLGAGTGLSHGVGSPAWRVMGSVDFREREAKDTDGDGIPDMRDLCRHRPEDLDGYQDKDGCPEPDNDQDGFLDPDDDCPMDPETFNDWDDEDGCPDQATRLVLTVISDHPDHLERASLRLGVADPVELLPDEPFERLLPAEAITVEVHAEGHHDLHQRIPLEGQERVEREMKLRLVMWGWLNLSVVDGEGQAIAAWAHPAGEERRLVPSEGARFEAPVGAARWTVGAEGYRSVVAELDIPAEGEARQRVVLEPAVVWLEGEQLELAEQLHFELDSAELSEASKRVLDDVAAYLREHPHIELLRVDGHADDSGSSRYNYDLSGRRAEAVRAYLVTRGVDQARLQAMGTGEARTVEGNDDESRRVVFLVLVWADHRQGQPVLP